MSPYEFLDDAPTADVGFRAWGETLDDCFRAAAEATLASMLANPTAVGRSERREVSVEHEEIDLALVRFLEELVYYKDAAGLLLRAAEVKVERSGEGWRVEARLEGERIDPARHELTGDVKAVTVHRLKVEQTAAGWQATIVLDV
jgi:SHS2 domain-containing protein